MYGRGEGILQDKSNPASPTCYLPNAAVGWKQPNGFYYPPAFHSNNLIFNNVDIRHFVVEPLFEPGTFNISLTDAANRYCTWETDMFSSFTDVDRQTELNDDNGSLTGLLADTTPEMRETISVNEDGFFTAPVETIECASDKHDPPAPATGPPGTAKTSPYEYVTTAMIADCAVGDGNDCSGMWGRSCTTADPANAPCYGVPLYRQYVTATEQAANARPVVRMMGQDIGQRSTLTANHGLYYIDSTVSAHDQKKSLGNSLPNGFNLNVFQPEHTYYMFFITPSPPPSRPTRSTLGPGPTRQPC
jgi:cell migration-inducing and hyaluronan-binding protein